eukprot:TRINITY_DN11860_c0_g1_i1.p1 TRINITY_DN11860_c0_g1~~TRINITY_DN11860_c0_g1_i1.p1  ORF type:complete len:315 (+),score=70.61 TRINITY_DN11860_c0_g1_i1:84-1028(+)
MRRGVWCALQGQKRGGSYRVLGLLEGASLEEVKDRYVELAKRHHPDMGGSEAVMKRLNEAYAAIRKKIRQKVQRKDRNAQHAAWEREHSRHGTCRGEDRDADVDDVNEDDMERVRQWGANWEKMESVNSWLAEERARQDRDADVDDVNEDDMERVRQWGANWEKMESVNSWLAEERARQDAERMRQEREEHRADALDEEHRAAFVAALADWKAKAVAHSRAESALLSNPDTTPSCASWMHAVSAWEASWAAFNVAQDAWGVWKAPEHLRVGDVLGAKDTKNGLWDSEARQWRGEAWATYMLWKRRKQAQRVHPD